MSKEQQLITTAFNLFYRYGVHATGINQVLLESGIAKKTMYSYFKSKDDLIEATIRYRDKVFYSWISQRMNRANKGIDAIEELFSALTDWFNGKITEIGCFYGCYFINVTAEYNDINHPIYQLCAAHKQSILQLIRDHVLASKIDNSRIDEVTESIGILKEGAIIQAFILGDLQAATKAKNMISMLLAGKSSK